MRLFTETLTTSFDTGCAYDSALINALSLGVVFQNAQGHIVTANPAAQNILGLSLDQMRGITSVDPRWRAVHDDGSAFAGQDHPAMLALASGEPVLDVTMGVFNPRLEDYTWINIRAVPVKDPGSAQVAGVYAVFEDITQQKLIRQQAQLSESRFQRLFAAMSEGVAEHELVLDVQGQAVDYRILDVNPAFEQQTGIAREAVVGQLASVAYGINAAPFLASYARVAHTRQALQFEQFFAPLNRHFLIKVFSPAPNQFATVFADITEHKQLEYSLRESRAFIASVIDSLTEHIAVIDVAGVIISVNAAWRRFACANADNDTHTVEVGSNYLAVCARACLCGQDSTATAALGGIRAVLTGERHEFTQEYPCHSPTEQRWFELRVVPLRGPDGGAVLIHRDITERYQAEQQIRDSEQHFRTLANGGSLLIWTSGLDKLCNYFNEPWLHFTGRTLAQEMGNGWAEGVHPDDFDLCLQTYVTAFEARQSFSMDYRLRHADGSYRWLRDDGNPRYDSLGNFLGYIGFCMDVTERKAAAQQIEHLAFYDSLTQLPNRRLMLDRLGQALNNCARRGRHAAVLMIDLDNFKSLNDTHGHAVGDQWLVEVAARLQSCIRAGDTVSRLGGDEFVIILEDLDESADAVRQAQAVGEKIRLCLNQPYTLHLVDGMDGLCQVSHHGSCSIGVALFLDQRVSIDEVLKRADTAMYQAKWAGRNTLRFFDPAMQATITADSRVIDNH